MAATIARATGHDTSRSKPAQRTGSEWASAEAATWNSSAQAEMRKDGSGYVQLRRRGRIVARIDFDTEREDGDDASLISVRLDPAQSTAVDILAKLRAVHAALYADGPDTVWSPDTLDAIAEAIGGYEGVSR